MPDRRAAVRQRSARVWSALSVRARTTLAATVVVALALLGTSTLLISHLHTNLTANVDAALREQLHQAARAVRADREPPTHGNAVTVRVLPPEPSRPRAEPPTDSHAVRPEPRPAPPPESSARTVPRTAATTVDTPRGPRTIKASVSTQSVDQATTAATRGLLIIAPVLLAVVAALTWIVTGRALRPVEAIRTQFTRLSAHDLDRRMPVPATGDEIARLATTLNATLDQLRDSVQRQRQFVADASHELRSPLSAMRTPLEVALAYPERANWPTVAAGTLSDLDRLHTLSTDLLLLARLDATTGIELSPLDLDELTRDTLDRRAPSRTTWITEITEESVPIEGHPTHLTRLITNLLDNAEAHAHHEVTVRLHEQGDDAVLEVLDDGPGIPAHEHDRIFERFTRLDTARTRTTGGSGLGLSLARDIASLHHGTITCTSTEHGAHFTTRLPLRGGA